MNKRTVIILLLVINPIAHSQPYIHDTIHSPIKDLLNLTVPSELANRKLAELGFVDVTAEPLNADPTGSKDSTEAVQHAVNFARDHQMVCFFPSGTYRISDTISCIQGFYRRQHGKLTGAGQFPCTLVGDNRPGKPRPTILLAPNSAGYDDPEHPKYVIHFWARNLDKPDQPQPNICFNQVFIGLNITIGRGNPGAVAIRLRGAQGSGIQDCTIDATHGLTGVEGGCGSGGSHAGITIIGGQIGMDLRQTQPAPTITGITLINQRRHAIIYGGRQALCAVGLKIRSTTPGPTIKIAPEWNVHFQGPLTLVDSEVSFDKPDPDNTLIAANRSFYLHSVFAKNAAILAETPGGDKTEGNAEDWTHTEEYAQSIKPAPYKGLQYETSIYLDGVKASRTLFKAEPDKAPPQDLQSQHLWPDNFPSWQSPNAVNVKSPPYNAKGDGLTDDTSALQKAVDENQIIFLPKGVYRLTRTLHLRSNTKLIGIGKRFSILAAHPDEPYFASETRPLVQTPDDKSATTTMAFCGIYTPYELPRAYTLHWRAGRHSIVRDVDFLLMPFSGYGRRSAPHGPRSWPLVQITNSGGGKWYNFESGVGLGDTGYRQILIEGTSEPLAFYHTCPEGVRSKANMEIADSCNVSIYGLKSEGNTYILWIRNSDNIRLFGYGGNASAREGSTLFRIENTPNFLLANMIDQPMPIGKEAIRGAVGTDPEKYHMIIEEPPSGRTIKLPPLCRPTLYK